MVLDHKSLATRLLLLRNHDSVGRTWLEDMYMPSLLIESNKKAYIVLTA